MNDFHVREKYLFTEQDFIGHSGDELHWKIECDALFPNEWKCIARMIFEIETRPFQAAIGIPRGGVELGRWLNEYSTQNSEHPYLIIDDVLNTGKTLFKPVNYFFNIGCENIKTIVLIDRDHKKYPVNVDIKGFSLSTNFEDTVKVISKDKKLKAVLV